VPSSRAGTATRPSPPWCRHGRADRSALAGQVAEDDALISTTEQSLWQGIAAIEAGERLNVVGAAVEDYVGERFGLVEEYGGHGIGTEMHQEPHVLN
jgi:methionyl aminopeptidase